MRPGSWPAEGQLLFQAAKCGNSVWPGKPAHLPEGGLIQTGDSARCDQAEVLLNRLSVHPLDYGAVPVPSGWASGSQLHCSGRVAVSLP